MQTDTSSPPTSRPLDALALLRATRALSSTAAVLLAVQLFGNLYEQLVSNVANLADPRPGASVDALAPGSPLFYYLPWAPLGVVLVVVLAVRLPRLGAPGWVVRRTWGALGALAVAVAAKAVLIVTVNPQFRDPGVDPGALRGYAVTWAFGNGLAIVAVAVALALLVGWRARVLDPARPERLPGPAADRPEHSS